MEYQPSSLERIWVKPAEQAETLAKTVVVSTLEKSAARCDVVPSLGIPIFKLPQRPIKAIRTTSFGRQVKTDFRNILLGLDRLLEDGGRLIQFPSREYYSMCRVLANRIMNHIKNLDGVQTVQLVGSLSREMGLVGTMDIDRLVVKKPECEGIENASAEHVTLSSIIKETRIEPAIEVYLESEKLIKFMFDAIHVDVVIVRSEDTRAIEQFIVPNQIATFYNRKYPNDESVVVAMKFLLSHVKLLIPEKRLKSVILEFIVWNEQEEMISEEGWSDRHLSPAEQMRELFYRCVSFVVSSYSIPKRFTKWETILRNAGVYTEEPQPDDVSLLSFNVDSIQSFARALCVDETEESSYRESLFRCRIGTVRYNGRVW